MNGQTMTTAQDRLREELLAATLKFEQDRRAEIIAAGGDPDEDRDPFEAVRAMADEWAGTAEDTDSRAGLLDRLAVQLDTSEVRALRLAAEAAAAVTPRLIVADADGGVRPAETAADLGVTESYVYRVLREQRRREPVAHPTYKAAEDQLADVPSEHREAADAYLAGFRRALDDRPPANPT